MLIIANFDRYSNVFTFYMEYIMKKNRLIALLLLLRAMRDRTVQMESDIEWLEKYPLLAVVPDLVGNEKGKEYYARDYK